MKFVDHGLTPADYRYKFLHYLDIMAPEVLETLKSICPLYEKVTNHFPCTSTMVHWLSGEIEVSGESEEYILLHLSPEYRYREISVPNSTVLKEAALSNFYALRKDFLNFLNRFGFASSDWLRRDLFILLGELTYNPKYFNSLVLAYSHGWNPASGDEFSFQIEGWKIEQDSKEFEKFARESFEENIRTYVLKTAKQFRADKYKQSTRTHDLSRVAWLVTWNMATYENLWEIVPYIDDFGQIGMNNEQQVKSAVDRLRKAFKLFESFGLPVRPWKKKKGFAEKSLTEIGA